MTVLSFAHLKNRAQGMDNNKAHERTDTHATGSLVHGQEKQSPPSPAPVARGGVLSFAHLKGKASGERSVAAVGGGPTKTGSVKREAPTVESSFADPDPCGGGRTAYRIPGVAKTAILAKVNFCEGCPRFLPATEQEKPYGNTYGRCLREGEVGSETEEELWRVIPEDAPVSRCYYYLAESGRE